MHIIADLEAKKLICPPKWLKDNTHYLTFMGSVAYGVSSDTSDVDIYGIAIPPKDHLFPHLAGEILGFGRQLKRFEQWQEHHIKDPDALGGRGREYDFQVFSIVKFFQLAMDNNPNIIDSLFTRQECVLHCTPIGEMIRDNRKMFLHKGAWHKFKGYAFSQLSKMSGRNAEGKRKETIEKWGFDLKFAYHVVRLLDEVEQILETGDIDLHRAKEHMKAIRRGDVKEAEIRAWFDIKEKDLEKLYGESKLQYSPDEGKIKELLLNCLEHHFGSLDAAIVIPEKAVAALREINCTLEKYQSTWR